MEQIIKVPTVSLEEAKEFQVDAQKAIDHAMQQKHRRDMSGYIFTPNAKSILSHPEKILPNLKLKDKISKKNKKPLSSQA